MSTTITTKSSNWVYNSFFSIAYAFIIGGLVLILMTTYATSYASLIGAIFGYCSAGIGISMIGGYIFYILSSKENQSRFSLLSIMYKLTPFIALLIIILLSVYMISKYIDRISSGKITKYYSIFTVISIIFISFQVAILYNASIKPAFRTSGNISDMSISSSYLLSVINLIIIITLNIALKYYSTDGYQNLIYQ